MHDDRRLVEQRIERLLADRVEPAVYPASTPLTLTAWHVPGEPVPVAEALRAEYTPFAVGQPWGRPWSTTWFRATGEVPAGWAGRRVEAVFDLGFTGAGPGFQAEALVYDAAGLAVKGIAPDNRYVPVADPATGGERIDLLIEAAGNPDILGAGFRPTPLGDPATAPAEPLYRLARADLAILDTEVWQLSLDLRVLVELMHELPVADPHRHELLRALELAADALDPADVAGTATAARRLLAGVLARPARASAHRISAVGHAHIDSAWLWPLRETVRKAARTYANVTALAERYPELVFAGPQAQQYAWIKQRYPEIFERVRRAVTAGRWVPVGGAWVEADGNLPGGEALARQLVHGKRFFLDEFGVECVGVWLPDSFGYTAAYPQLARLAGARWFLTQKLSWNDTDRFPHHTFRWEGIDGTRVFTHFPPVDTYNATMSARELAHAVANYAEKGRGTRSLLPFGHGDGGGGPTRGMLERARRLADLEGAPRVTIESPDDFFAAAEAEYPDAPVWSGELYLELHRGTFTTQARLKAGNRRCEHLLRAAELWAASATVLAGAGYPAADLDRLWKAVLLNQFHDILPGSSIAWVNAEAERAYAETAAELETVIEAAAGALVGPGLWVFNAAPGARSEVLTVPADHVARLPASLAAEAQRLTGGAVAVPVTVAAGAAVSLTGSVAPPAAPVTVLADGPVTVLAGGPVTVLAGGSAGGPVLDNGLVRVTFDAAGLLRSVRDLPADRELLAPSGGGNTLRLYRDTPNRWDAWDLDRHHRNVATDLTGVDEIEVVASGPLLGAVRVRRSFGDSRIEQTVTVRAGSRRIDVTTDLDWHERERLLKAIFPVDVHADRSTAEIQFGHVHRPTHTNTSWDAARFEVYAHRWIHIGEPGYGVALLTDSTYGYHAERETRPDGGSTTTVGLSLLRAPRCPDPDSDAGRHRFTYALVPGADVATAIGEAYALNLPLRVVAGGVGAADALVTAPLVSVEGAAVVPEAVKLADDGSGDIVVRLYESLGGRATARLRCAVPLARAEAVDLLERPFGRSPSGESAFGGGDPPVGPDGSVRLTLRPFQVVTLRLTRGPLD